MMQYEIKWDKIIEAYQLQFFKDQSLICLHMPEQDVFNGFTYTMTQLIDCINEYI